MLADVRAFTAFGCRPSAAITSITFQNDDAVFGAEHLTVDTIRHQVMAVLEGGGIAAVKTGMLPTRAVVREVARLFRETSLPAPVVDPVMRSSSGYALIEEEAVAELINELLPLARLVTPNIPEAEQITGLRINDIEGMREAARMIRTSSVKAVLVKGGHLGNQDAGDRRQEAGHRERAEAIDLLDNEGQVTTFRGDWIPNAKLRGTGCMLSAAIAACLANGKSLEEAINEAKQFVTNAILQAQRTASV